MAGSVAVEPAAVVTNRDPAIDLTKGALVVLMFVYHSVNYFCEDKSVLRYIHFLPSSFIFIAGFLATAVQQRKVDHGGANVRWRLFKRGLKLLGIFVGLNLAAHSVFTSSYNSRAFGTDVFLQNLGAIFVTGGQRAAVFDVLLPISYLLILASALFARHTRARAIVLGGLATSVINTCLILNSFDRLVFNLELLSMGLLGMAVGLVPLRHVTAAASSLAALVVANAGYAALAAFRYPTYAVNIAGVCLTLLLLFSIGVHASPSGLVYRWLVLLGRYSLIGYIGQIAILQMLFHAAHYAGISSSLFLPALLVTTASTTAFVIAIELTRRKSQLVESSYRTLFA